MSKNKKGKQRAHFQEPPVSSSSSEDYGYNGLDQIYEQDEDDDDEWLQRDDGWEDQGDGQEWNDDRGWGGNEGAEWGGQRHGGERHAASGGWASQGLQQTPGQGGYQAGGFSASIAHALGQAQAQAAKAGHNEERAAGGVWGTPNVGRSNNGAGGGNWAAGNNRGKPAVTSAAQGRGRTTTAWQDNPTPANIALPPTQGAKGGWQSWANEAGMRVPQQQVRAPVQAQPQRRAAAPPPTQGTWNAWGAEAMVNGYRAPPVSNPVVQVAGGTRTDISPQQRSQVLNTLLKGLPRHAQAPPPPPPKELKEKEKQGTKNKKQQQRKGGRGAEAGNLWTAQAQDDWGATGQDGWGGQGYDDHGAEAQDGWGGEAGAGDDWGQQANDSGWGGQTQRRRGEQTRDGWGDQTRNGWGNQTQNGWGVYDLWRHPERAQAQQHHQSKRRPAQKRDGWGGALSEDDWEQIRNEEFDAPASGSSNMSVKPSLFPAVEPTRANKPLRRDDSFYAIVTFKVGNCLFKVSRRHFEEGSVVFRDMFSMPAPADGNVEGASDDNPITLDGIAEDEFRQFLRVTLPLQVGQYDLTISQWASALKLSTMWEFNATREMCIAQMTTLEINGSQRFAIARDYDIPQWVLPALNALARKERPLDAKDGRLLGLDWALKIAAVRESVQTGIPCQDKSCTGILKLSCFSGSCPKCGTCQSASKEPALYSAANLQRASVQHADFMPKIKEVFGLKE